MTPAPIWAGVWQPCWLLTHDTDARPRTGPAGPPAHRAPDNQLEERLMTDDTPTRPLTARTITDAEIEALMDAAGAHGDASLYETCRRALMRRGGRGDCARAVNWARAESIHASC